MYQNDGGRTRTEADAFSWFQDVSGVRWRPRKSALQLSHGGNRGSNPLGDAKKSKALAFQPLPRTENIRKRRHGLPRCRRPGDALGLRPIGVCTRPAARTAARPPPPPASRARAAGPCAPPLKFATHFRDESQRAMPNACRGAVTKNSHSRAIAILPPRRCGVWARQGAADYDRGQCRAATRAERDRNTLY